MKRRVLSMLMACIMMFTMTTVSAFAADYEPAANPETRAIEIAPMASSSGSTGKMNSFNGMESAPWPVTVSAGTKTVTSVSLSVTVSSGSARMNVYVEAPDGTIAVRTIGSSTTLSFTEFRGLPANGKWYVSIQTLGTVSTATGRLTVNY